MSYFNFSREFHEVGITGAEEAMFQTVICKTIDETTTVRGGEGRQSNSNRCFDSFAIIAFRGVSCYMKRLEAFFLANNNIS